MIKVQLFREGHKHVCNRPYGSEIHLVDVKTIRKAELYPLNLETMKN